MAMSETTGFDHIWDSVVKVAIKRCIQELDNKFSKKANVVTCDLDAYKEELRDLYREKREWLKKEYLPKEEEPILDFHKLSAIVCRCIIGSKPFSYDIKVANSIFRKVSNDENRNQQEKIKWEVDNIYVNYKLAFLVAEGIIFDDLLFWCQDNINKINECIEKNPNEEDGELKKKINIYGLLIGKLVQEHGMYSYKTSSSHDDFFTSSVIALMKSDNLMRDFDYLGFSICMFQWQEYTKKQFLHEILTNDNSGLTLDDLV